jgi:sulfite exporter TauE/SafE
MRSIAVFAIFSAFAAVAEAQVYAAWSRFREITVNTTNAGGGADVPDAVANFPLLVRLANTSVATGANVLSEALPGGADLRFTDSTGNTALAYQIENWSASSGAVWVKVPTVPGNAVTKIRMYWGRAGQTSLSNGAAVFDTANGYTGVWHLNESGAVNVSDATGNGLHFTGHAQVLAVPGVAGNARYYNQGVGGGTDFYVDERANHPKFYATGTTTAITISAWVNRRADGVSASQAVFSNFRYSAGGNRSYALMMQPTGEFSTLTSVQGTGDTRRVITAGTFPGNQWHHVVARINSAGPAPIVTFYVNGVAQTTSGTNTAGANAAVFAATAADAMPLIGALERAFNQQIEAFIDEVQFSNGTLRDTSWIKLTYATQRPGGTAVALGATQSVTPRPLFYPLKHAVYILNAPVTANTPAVSGAVTGNFAIAPGTLPAGLVFTSSTGAISGTPTAAVSQTQFIVTATVGGSPAADTITITVSAGDPPGAPTNLTTVSGNSQVTVGWTAPLSSGASPITSYTARATQDTSKTCTWTTGPLSCTVTGLTNGTSYTFVVRAVSAVGPGPFSATSLAVAPAGRPGVPLNVTVSQPNKTTLNALISWSAPASNGGATIVEYYAIASNGQTCFSSPIASPSCTITFATSAAYTFRVYAVNSAGAGDTSAATAPFTPTGILSGYAIRVSGAAKPFTFALTPEAAKATDALTMTISDMHGRAVWTKTVNPRHDGASAIVWNGRTTNGLPVSAGVYMVRVSSARGGATSTFIQKAVELD